MKVKIKLLLVSAIAEMFAVGPSARGGTIAQYSFPALSPTVPILSATTVDPNATASDVTIGASVNAPVSTNDFWISKPVVSLSRLNDTALAVYFQATITAASGYELNMDSFSFDGARGGAATPRTYEVHSSVAGLARDADIFPAPPTSLTSGSFTIQRGPIGATDTLPTITADLTSPVYDHLTSLTMRVYFQTPTTNQNIDIDNISFDGIVALPGTVTTSTWTSAAAGNWNMSSNWSAGVPNGIDAEADFLSAITGTRTVFSDTPVILGTMKFNNVNTYHITGGGSLTMQTSTGSALIQVQSAGTQKINLPLIIASNTNLDVASGATLLISDPVTIRADKTVDKTGNVIIQAPITIESGGVLNIVSGPAARFFGAALMDSGAKIDIKDQSAVFDYGGQTSPLSTIQEQVQTGYANGSWTGTGINSSAAAATSGNQYKTALGFAEATAAGFAGGSFFGQSVGNEAVLVRYTYFGDADINGAVDSVDFNLLAASFSQTGKTWFNGDFNYDGTVDSVDFNQLAANFSQVVPADGIGSLIPEPGSAAAVALASLLTLGRRCRVTARQIGSIEESY